MKILFYEAPYGRSMSAIHAYELASNLRKLGHTVTFLSTPPSPPADTPPDVTNIIRLSTAASKASQPSRLTPRLLQTARYILHRATSLRYLVQYVSRLKPLAGIYTIYLLLKMEVKLAWEANKLIAHSNKAHSKFDLIYRRHAMLNTETLISKLYHIPCVRELNGIVRDEIPDSWWADPISLCLIKLIENFNISHNHPTAIIAVTEKLRIIYEQHHRYPLATVIPNGANTNIFYPMPEDICKGQLGLPDYHYILFVGSLSHWQGLETLMAAVPIVTSQCPSARFLIVGDGRMKPQLEKQAASLKLQDKFIFTGKVPYSHIPLYINASDICVAPFPYKRNARIGLSPLKIGEYLACGKPVVTTRISGLEYIESEHLGLLCDPDSPLDLACSILQLLTNQALYNSIAQNTRPYITANRSWPINARQTAEFLEKTLR